MTFVNTDWLMFHHDPQQTGYAEESSAPSVNHTIWNFSSRLTHSSPIITQGIVIITSTNDNKIYALNEANGSIIWNISIPDLGWNYTYSNWMFFNSFSPAVADNIVFVGNAKCKIYALNLSTGASLWNFSGNGMTTSLFAVQNGKLIFRCHDDGWNNDTVYLLDSNNGNSISTNKFPCISGDTINPAISIDNLTAYMTIYPCTMSSVNLITDKIIWNFTVQEGCGDVGLSHPILINDLLIFGSDKGYVYFVNVSNPGNPLLKNKTYIGESIVQIAPAVWKDMIFFGTGYRTIRDFNPPASCQLISKFGNFYAINLTNNSIVWTFPVGDAIQSSPAVADGKVFFLAENNIFYTINASNGASIWNYTIKDTGCAFENDAYTSSPAVSDGVVVIGVPEGRVYAFKTIQLVFVKVAWDDFIDFDVTVNQHANYFLEKSGLNACGMKVEIKIVNGSPNITGQEICDAWKNNKTSPILEGIKDHALRNNIRGDRYIGLTTYNMSNNCGVGGYTTFIPDIHYDTVIDQYDDRALTSHELGHSYGLCDEYCYDGTNYHHWCWLEENNSLNNIGSCPNLYLCNDRIYSCVGNIGTRVYVSGKCESGNFWVYDTNCSYGDEGNPNTYTCCYPAVPFRRERACTFGESSPYRSYCDGTTSCGADACSCNSNIKNGTYLCGRGECNYTLFYCYGFRFNDDTFSIMSMGDLPHSNYSPTSISHLNRVLCENRGFIALPPLTTYNEASGAAASKYISKSINQKDSDYLKVNFVLRKNGTGLFKNVEILKDGQITDIPRGSYSLVVKDNKREILYTKSFEVSFVTMGDPPKIYNETSITFIIPYVNGAKSMEIRKDDKVLFSIPIPIINNGGFETGDFTGWIADGPGDHKVDTQVPYTAKYSALIGFRDHSNVANGYDYIYR
ncbi:MAG: PQQ-binding-like beta-propeller repeat protein [Candidatus Altarchaeum sp.]|nr:PQQ-binding-like beta-propeller repeat protein [Candidatus Altarchaeum sp.]